MPVAAVSSKTEDAFMQTMNIGCMTVLGLMVAGLALFLLLALFAGMSDR